MVPSASVDEEPSKVIVSGVPLGVAFATAMGGVLTGITGVVTTMGVLAELLRPKLSVTVRVVVYVPAVVKLCEELVPVAEVPSPKFQA
jgi:hypothetical protein